MHEFKLCVKYLKDCLKQLNITSCQSFFNFVKKKQTIYELLEWIISVNTHSIIYLKVKEPLARSRCCIWSLCDINGIRTHSYLVCKRTLNHWAKLAKWLCYGVSTCLYVAFDSTLLSCCVRVSEWIYTLQFTWMVRNSLLKAGAISEVQVIATGLPITSNSKQLKSIQWNLSIAAIADIPNSRHT